MVLLLSAADSALKGESWLLNISISKMNVIFLYVYTYILYVYIYIYPGTQIK